ncbi:uncharacterized protein F4812DRAFT_121560 [Daldinia caldariorum]|uniref:uncharacterized protein n=1 Tax=Daldinia caldariorum TaxID=326644 RepID=UPI002007FB3B|nr:uncharacterized protein F4812DRAFT_121560 [Daldinia caldariorum]KAI1465415.1 hypothetical protein F4812DRAFT_121560 [Daldinia caldariorum]
MAVVDSFDYARPSMMTIDIMAHSTQRHPLPQFQSRFSRNTQWRSRKQKPSDIFSYLAKSLSKRTLRQYLDAIAVPLPLTKGHCHLELLPQDIINRISQYVPYESLIYLSWVSKALNRMVDPYLAPHETKLAFVIRAERDFHRHFSGEWPNLGCFMCFKVLPADLFAVDQPLQAELRRSAVDEPVIIDLRRFCIGCGIQSGLHKAGEELNTRVGGRFWICNCLCILGDQTLVCRDCGTVCQLKPKRLRGSYY